MRICAYKVNENMKVEPLIRLMAGSLVLLGVGLTCLMSPWWLLLPTFVGANLAQSAITGICPPYLILSKLGWLDKDGTIRWGGAK